VPLTYAVSSKLALGLAAAEVAVPRAITAAATAVRPRAAQRRTVDRARVDAAGRREGSAMAFS
jgi:hypothetical protein